MNEHKDVLCFVFVFVFKVKYFTLQYIIPFDVVVGKHSPIYVIVEKKGQNDFKMKIMYKWNLISNN